MYLWKKNFFKCFISNVWWTYDHFIISFYLKRHFSQFKCIINHNTTPTRIFFIMFLKKPSGREAEKTDLCKEWWQFSDKLMLWQWYWLWTSTFPIMEGGCCCWLVGTRDRQWPSLKCFEALESITLFKNFHQDNNMVHIYVTW